MSPEADIDPDTAPSLMGRIMGRPLLAGIAAGVIGLLVILMMTPPVQLPPREAVVIVSAEAPPAEAAATEARESTGIAETNDSPPAAVPVVAEAAIVVTDTGLNRRVAEAIDKSLPREATLAVSSYATDPAGTAAAFKTSGRDVWLQVAAQSTRSGIDPGPLAVSAGFAPKENMDLLKRQIALAGGNAVGIYIPHDADLTAEPDMWRDLAMDLIADNQMILDSTKAKVATVLYMQRSEAQINAYLKTDVVVSGKLGPAGLRKALDDAIPVILNQQQAIVVLTDPTAAAVETLGTWVKTFESKGIRLVPASVFTGLKP